jgi:hypothetical protein
VARPVAGEVKGGPYQGTHTRGNWESDNAVDIYAPEGTPVYAAAFGKIGPASQYGSLNSNDPAMAGERLHLYADLGGQHFYYAHLSKIVVQPGSKVKPGQLIGYSGSANGVPHLHFAVEKGSPYDYTKGKAPATSAPPAAEKPAATPEPEAAAPVPAAQLLAQPPPAFMPPLPGGGLPAAGPMMPGSQVYSLDRRAVYSNWQRLAQTAPASQPLQQFVQLSGLGLEDE